MNPIVAKALAICAAHLLQIPAPYGWCTSITDCRTTYTSSYTAEGYAPGYGACARIQNAADTLAERDKEEADKRQLAIDAAVLKQAIAILKDVPAPKLGEGFVPH